MPAAISEQNLRSSGTARAPRRQDGEPVCVQYGCGLSAPEGWRNFDASPTLRFERIPLLSRLYQKNASRFPKNVEYGDIVRGLPVPAGTARVVFASHVLEHLSLEDFRLALRNTRRLLEPGGVFRLIVPDLEQLARSYLDDQGSGAAERFIQATGMGLVRRARGPAGLATTALGNSRHQWMWDYKSLHAELSRAEFTDIRRCQAGDSREPSVRSAEDPGRFVDAVGVECRRPL